MELYPFQQEMVDKLHKNRSALCGDDMGVGKTVEAIALDRYHRINNPPDRGQPRTLVVTTLSMVDGWVEHFADWAPHLKVIRVDPKNRHKFTEAVALGSHDVYICHWESLRLMPELGKRLWFHVIADEVHRAKSRKAQQTRALKKIRTKFKLALSGTPADNRPQDIWSILNWLWPTYYTSYWKFFNRYIESEIVYPAGYHKMVGVKNLSELRDEMRPWYIRRLKEDVLQDLPDKYYRDVWVELTPKQRRAYNTMKKDMIAWIGDNEDQPIASPVIVAQLMRLQQFALAHAELRTVTVRKRNKKTGEMEEHEEDKVFLADPSAKIDALMDILADTNESVVVFSNFVQVANMVCERLDKAQISYVKLTGDTPGASRGDLVARFQRGEAQVFVGTIGAGGEGITLTRASTVIFLDRNWSPSKNRQAEDRLHRIGQKNAVQVIDIMARNTVDLGRRQQLTQKWAWIRELLGDKIDPKKYDIPKKGDEDAA